VVAAASCREATKYENAFRSKAASLDYLLVARGHDMTALSLEPTRVRFATESLDQRDQARAMRGKRPVRAFSVAPFVFVAAVLFATNVWIATRLQGQSERALLFATFGSAGMPMFQWTSLACGHDRGSASGARLDRDEMLALLAGG
jgi:hypothetical protein